MKKTIVPKYFILKYKIEINETLFITVDIQNIQHISLKLFSQVVKIKRKLIEENISLQKRNQGIKLKSNHQVPKMVSIRARVD